MSRQQPHRDVAAYALGILEPADTHRFEEHLAGCVACAVGLSGFTGVAAALSELAGPGRLDARPRPQLLERLTGAVVAQRRRERRRRFRLVAVAAALIVALPTAVVTVQDAEDPEPPRVVASDPVSGVTASVALEDRDWGTSVAMRLSGLAGPRTCRLIAIGKDGVEHPVLSWWVPKGGYGVTEEPGGQGPLDLEASTGLHPAEIGRWEVRSDGGERLLSIGG
ncbi:anti-sigma factor family protein [Streptomyces peucetius]|uniref:Zf-HC2 domain-containing protein n=1 Tax=Streptomyces peucetius TaxID=1950 RepID=A0ABY6IFW9_STRPE|nr:zf-HC2 domain-containing protein [Streptomyces peucetius]UYQ65918.1 zf-HC2 domain-containing protein [Streptomyces peucetius]